MIWRSVLACVAISIAFGPASVLAQYGYPSGYGGSGWGGWGSTAQGSIARGLGYFNMGRGAYNYDTAAARSINTNTLMQWNEYLYRSHVVGAHDHAALLRANRQKINKAQSEIYDRLRNHPEARDIEDGDALNVLLDVLLDPSLASATLRRASTPLKAEVIQEIPFEAASEGMTICLHQMTLQDGWPLALRVDGFKPERDALQKVIEAALKEDEKGNLQPKSIEAVGAAINQLWFKFEKLVPQTDPDYIASRDHIKAMAGITKMLYSPRMEQVIAELEDYQGTTLGDLLSFMQAFNLRFAVANSYRQKLIYRKLYPMMSEQADGAVASAGGSSPVSGTVNAIESAGSSATKTVEGVGTQAINGLKSAAVGLFKDMDWKYLSGWGGTPPPPKAGQP
jgi:hypothetical protein